jgi:TPR repeat protein
MEMETKTLNIGNGRTIEIPCNYQDFILDYSGTPEGSGWKKEDVLYILECVKENRLEELDLDAELMNSIGCFFDDGICVKPDVNVAVYWYEQAIKEGDDLARSNLADILRKGSQGYPKDLKRAFELYKACGLPYAHYRVGEFYEHGWGTEKDLEAAKAYYRQAYKEGHGLAKKKLKEWNFME